MAFQNFCSMVHAHSLAENLDTLPKLRLRPEISEAATEFKCILEALELNNTGDNTGSSVEDIVKQTAASYNKIKQCPDYAGCFQSLTGIANGIANRILGVFNTLSQVIYPEVQNLKSKIEQRTQELITQNNQEAFINRDITTINVPNYQVIIWDQLLNKLGGADIVAQNFKDITGNTATSSFSDIQSFLSGVANLSLIPIAVDDNTYQYIRDTALANCGNIEASAISDMVDYALVHGSGSNQILADSVGNLNTSRMFSDIIHKIENHLEHLPDAVEHIRKTPFNLSQETLSVLQSNLTKIYNQLVVAAYCLMICRKELKDTLVIDANTLNGDVTASFLQNNSAEDIAKYIAVMHTDTNVPIPNTGITVRQIADNRSTISDRYSERQQEIVTHGTVIRTQHRVRAVTEVLTDHLKETDPARVPEGMAPADFLRSELARLQARINELDATNDNNLESFLYNFIISTYYHGSVVATVNKLFGSEVTKTLEMKENLETKDIQVINVNVAARIAADFLMSNIFEVVK